MRGSRFDTTTRPRRFRDWTSAWLPVVAFELLVLFVSSRPHLRLPAGVPYLDKAAHFGEYAVLGLLLVRALRLSGGGRREVLVAAVLLASGLGVADELFQRLIPGRFSSIFDWGTDVAGAVAGCLVAWKAKVFQPREDGERTAG